jgi:hypothetical protein
VSDDPYAARTFEEFWPHYLAMHSHPTNQRVHALATGSFLALAATGLATGRPLLLLAAPLADHVIAQLGHRLFEGNRTTPWRHPLWHARAELRLFRGVVLGHGQPVGRQPRSIAP